MSFIQAWLVLCKNEQVENSVMIALLKRISMTFITKIFAISGNVARQREVAVKHHLMYFRGGKNLKK